MQRAENPEGRNSSRTCAGSDAGTSTSTRGGRAEGDDSMDDLISRTTLLNDLSYCAPELWQDEEYIKSKIIKQPVVDAAPVIHGRWIKMTGMMPPEYHGHYECSECQWHMKGLRNSWTREEELSYCPNCGAKMKE